MNLSTIISWLYSHPALGGVVTFIISAAESIPIIGTIVPGSIMMIAIGSLIGIGILPFWQTLLWAIAGAIVGDSLGYWLGYYFKYRIHYLWPFNKFKNVLILGETFFRKHSGKSVFIGRFVGPVRAIVPVVAGMFGMPVLRFYIANILSGIGWAPLYMLPGILLGTASLSLPPYFALRLIMGLLLGLTLLLIAAWLFRHSYLQVIDYLAKKTNRYWMHITTTPNRRHPIARLFQYHNLTNSQHQLNSAIGVACLFVLFLLLLIAVYYHAFSAINQNTYDFFRNIRFYNLNAILLAFTYFGEKYVLMPAIIALFCWFLIKKYYRCAWHWLLLCVLTIGLTFVIKHLMHIPRPAGLIKPYAGFAFPSGHSSLGVIFYGFLASLIADYLPPAKRRYIFYVTMSFIVLIAFSRLYVGAHWLTDVWGGILLGSICLCSIRISYQRHTAPLLIPWGMIAIALLSSALSWSYYFKNHFINDTQHSQLVRPIIVRTEKEWWDNKGDQVSLIKKSRLDSSGKALQIQWADRVNNIRENLLHQGWVEIKKINWYDLLHPITLAQHAEYLPLWPTRLHNTPPVLILVKPQTHKTPALVLRLWESDIRLKPHNVILYLGLLNNKPYWTPRTPAQSSPPATIKDIERAFVHYLQDYRWKQTSRVVPNTQNRKKAKLPFVVHLILIKPKEYT